MPSGPVRCSSGMTRLMPVRRHDALRLARGTGGVDEADQVVRRDLLPQRGKCGRVAARHLPPRGQHLRPGVGAGLGQDGGALSRDFRRDRKQCWFPISAGGRAVSCLRLVEGRENSLAPGKLPAGCQQAMYRAQVSVNSAHTAGRPRGADSRRPQAAAALAAGAGAGRPGARAGRSPRAVAPGQGPRAVHDRVRATRAGPGTFDAALAAAAARQRGDSAPCEPEAGFYAGHPAGRRAVDD
jgi:hypothetical protein